MTLNLLIVDDHPLVRVGVRHIVLAGWPDADIREAESAAAAEQACAERRPDIVVLDLSLPDASGLESAARLLRATRNEVPVLVLSLNAESAFAARLLQMGVAGYLPKDRTSDELVHALRRIQEGKRYVTPEMAERLLGLLDRKSPQQLPHERLTAQEHRVMLLMAAGRSPAQIADAMHLSVKTVGTYRARILDKTGWSGNVELTKYCVQHGLTDPA